MQTLKESAIILYNDINLCIELIAESNIMCASLLDTTFFSIVNLKDSFFVTMEMLEKHPVKKIIFQSNVALLNLPENNYAIIMEVLISGLASTTVEKVANIYLEKSEGELKRISLAYNLLKEMEINLEFRNFDDMNSAIAWLESI